MTKVSYIAAMPDRTLGTHYLRAWREDSGLSLRGLSGAILEQTGYEVSHANIGRIEKGEQPYTQELLEAESVIFGCTPSDLLSRDPAAKVSTEKQILSLLRQIDGLPEDALVPIYGVIDGFIRRDDASQTQSPARDRPEPASPRRELAPSGKKVPQRAS